MSRCSETFDRYTNSSNLFRLGSMPTPLEVKEPGRSFWSLKKLSHWEPFKIKKVPLGTPLKNGLCSWTPLL